MRTKLAPSITAQGLAALVCGGALVLMLPTARSEQPKDEPKKERPRERLFKDLPGLDDAQKQQVRKALQDAEEQLRQAREQIERLRKERGVPPGAFPGLPGIGPMRPGRLGVMVSPPDDTLADHLNLKDGQGLVIDNV